MRPAHHPQYLTIVLLHLLNKVAIKCHVGKDN